MMKKGQTMELVELTLVVVGISIMIIISYFMFTSRTPQLKRITTEEYTYERLGDVVSSLYNTKVSGTERSLAQLLADRIVTNSSIIDYGENVGIIDIDKQLTQFFDAYLDEKWNLTDSYLSLGHQIPRNINRKITYQIILPIPSVLYPEIDIIKLNTWLE